VPDTKLDTDPRLGWFKILIPKIKDVFCGLFLGEAIEPLPFLYGRLDPEQVSFDCTLSIPFLAIDSVVLAQVDKRAKAPQLVTPGAVGVSLQLITLKLLAEDQENRCYIPAKLVVCIIPLNTGHPIVATLVQITSESGLIIPSVVGVAQADPGQIVDMTGRVLDISSKESGPNDPS